MDHALPDLPDILPIDAPHNPIEIRLLTPDEVQSLAPDFIDRQAELPDPATSFFIGAVEAGAHEDDPAKISFLCVQLKIHAQPFLLRPGHENMFRSLIHAATKTIQERLVGRHYVYLFVPPDEPGLQGLARAAGMLKEPWDVLSKGLDCREPEPVLPEAPTDAELTPIQETIQ